MLQVGVTGGIGSGKSVVCQVFSTLGIPVFNADKAARYLMESDPGLAAAISALLGSGVYSGGRLDRAKVAAIIYKDPAALRQLNALVHPATMAYAAGWLGRQQAPYAIKEAALFFESGSYKEMDVMLGVYAPEELRITRAMQRSALSREQVTAIIARQMNEDEKMKRCSYVIINDGMQAVLPQVLQLHELFLQD